MEIMSRVVVCHFALFAASAHFHVSWVAVLFWGYVDVSLFRVEVSPLEIPGFELAEIYQNSR
jgi:hypothetical protein